MKKHLLILLFILSECYADGLFVGTHYRGGIIFCVSETQDLSTCVTKGSGYYFLIAAPINSVVKTYWSAQKSDTDATSQSDGLSNTNNIIAARPNDSIEQCAAQFCREYRNEGYGDWYLGSIDEVNKLIEYHTPYLSPKDIFWSSTEFARNAAYYYNKQNYNPLKIETKIALKTTTQAKTWPIRRDSYIDNGIQNISIQNPQSHKKHKYTQQYSSTSY